LGSRGSISIPSLIVLSVAFGTFCATLLGGLAALRFQTWLYLILAFSAGTVIALTFFDLMPEALRLSDKYAPEGVLAVTAVAFFAYALVDRLLLLHGDDAVTASRGWAGAGSLSAHSFMDGLALGIGFQASMRIGIAVAVAILAHDCSDGMNTVSLVLKNGGTRRAAFGWLLVDAVAPVLGAAASLVVRPSTERLAYVLAAFAGFFLYIGASDLLPESLRNPSRVRTMAATLAGAATLYIVVRLAG
jgi:zinc transporter ZupT